MSWIKDEDMKAIRQQADIVDIISQYISLDKKGKDYKGVCPFHDDHDPSMSVSVDKQIFKCFVCGTGGNAFTFVQKMESCSFPEAVYKVATMIGYPLSIQNQTFHERVDENQVLYDALHTYIDFTQYELNSESGANCLRYLKNRHISNEMIQKFQLGYAPDASYSMRFLNAKQIPIPVLKNTGLIFDELNPNIVFHDRFMIPIHDENGKPVGFSARRLSEDKDIPKYINTSQTPLYEKGNLIFNYHRAKETCRKEQRCILVEGAMDVLAYEKAGIHEAVACLGTACTSHQLHLLKRLQVPILVGYDGDQAGKNATYKFCKMAVDNGLKFQIINNKTNLDPDEIIEKYGKQELVDQLSVTISFVEFLFDYLKSVYDLNNYEDKKKYAQEIYSYVKRTCDEFEIPMYIKRIQVTTGFDFSAMTTPTNTRKEKVQSSPTYVMQLKPGRLSAEKAVLTMILVSKKAANEFKNQIGFFQDKLCNQLSLYCYDLYRHKDSIDLDSLMSRIDDENVRNLLIELMTDYDFDYNEDFFQDSLIKIKECTLQEQIDLLNEKIAQLANPLEKAKLAIQKNELITKRLELRRRDG